MGKDDLIGALIIIGFIFLLVFFGIFGEINSNGGVATENTYEVCSGENHTVLHFLWVPINACIIDDCDNEYDGIMYCNSRIFIVCEDKFCEKPSDQ